MAPPRLRKRFAIAATFLATTIALTTSFTPNGEGHYVEINIV